MYAGLVEDASTSLTPQPSVSANTTKKEEPPQQRKTSGGERRGQKVPAPDHIRELEAAAVSSKGIVGYGAYEYNSLRCFIRALECDINNAEAWDNVGTSLRGPKEAVIIRLRRGDVRVERGEHILSQTAKRGAGEVATITDGNEDIVFEDEDEDDIVDVVFNQQLCFIRAIELDPFISSCWNKLGTTIPSGAFDMRGTDATGTKTYVTVDLSRHLTPFAASEAEAARERREMQKAVNSVVVANGKGIAVVKPAIHSKSSASGEEEKRRADGAIDMSMSGNRSEEEGADRPTKRRISTASSSSADEEGAAARGILRFNKRECFARAIALDMRNAHAWYNLASLLTIKKMTIATMLTQGVGSRSVALAANQNNSQVLQSVVSLMGAPSGVMASQASAVFSPATNNALNEQQALANPLAPMYGMLTVANAGNKFLQQLTLNKLSKADASATGGAAAEDASASSPNAYNRDSSMVVPSPSITALLHHTANDAVLAANSMAALEGRVVPTNSSLSISGGVVNRKVVGGGVSLGTGVGVGGEARKDSVISSSTMRGGGGGDDGTLVVAPDDPYLVTIIGPYGRRYYFDKKQCLVKVLECEPEDPFAWYNLSCVMKRGETVDITVRVFVDDGGDTEESETKGEEKSNETKGALAVGAIAALGRADELLEREKERRERKQERESQMLQKMTADGLTPTTASPKSLLEKIKQSREENAAAMRTTSSSSKANSNKADVIAAAPQSDTNKDMSDKRQRRRHKRRKTALKTISITAKDCCINALRASNFTDFYAWTKLGQVLGNSDTAVLAVKDPLSPTLEVVESKVTGRDCFLEALHLNPMYPNAWDGLATTLGKTEKVTFVHPEHSMWNIKYREALQLAAKEKNTKAEKDGDDAATSSSPTATDTPIVIVGSDKVTGAPIFSRASHEQQAAPKPSTVLLGKTSTSTTDAAGAPQRLTEVLNGAGCWNKAIECDERYTMAWSNLGYTMGKTEKYTVLNVPRSQRDCFLAGIGCDDKGINDKAWNGLGINLKSNEQLTLTEDPSRPPPPPPAEPGSGLEEFIAKDITNNKKIGKKEAYGRSALANPYNSSAWNNLGTTLGNTGSVVIDGVELYEQDCYLRSVTLNPNNSAGWDNLGSTVGNKKGVKKANDDDMLLGEGDGDETASMVSGGARSNSALTATVLVAGIPYTRQQCFLKAVNCNKNNSSAWGKLCGTLKGDETVPVAGVSYDRLQCVLRALACDFDNSRAWNRLGRLIDAGSYGTKEPHAVHIAAHTLEKEKAAALVGPKLTKEGEKKEKVGTVDKADATGNEEDNDENKTRLKKKRAEEEADAMIMEDSDDVDEDDDFPSDAADAAEKEKRRRTKAKLNGLLTPDPFADLEPYVEVQGKPFNARDCYARACESDSSYTIAWVNLGASVKGGEEVVSVKGKPYQKKNCFIKALEAEEANAATWNSLGAALTSTEEVVVSGKKFTKLKCYARALELLPGNSAAWVNVGSMLMSPAEVVANEIAAAQYKQLQLQMQQQSSPRNTNGTTGTTAGRPLSGARSRPSSAKAITNGAARPLSAKPNNKLQQTSVEVEGVTYSQLDCFVEAIKGDFNNGAAWSGLGALLADDPDAQYEFSDAKAAATEKNSDTAASVSKVAADFLPPSLKDVPILYDSVPQLQNMLNAQPLPLSKAAQQRLAVARASHPTPLTVSIRGEAYTKQMCYVRAVECARQSSVAWNNLGTTIVSAEEAEERRKAKRGGSRIHGNDNEDTNIAAVGGDNDDDRPLPTGTATVNGRTYSKCDCYLKAVLLDGKSAVAWVNLGSAMSDTDVVQYTLNSNTKNKNNTGAGEEGNTSVTEQHQEEEGEAVDALVPSASTAIATSAPALLSRTEVLSKAVELEPYNSCTWLVLGLLGAFEPSRVRTANPHVFANNLSTASTSSQHGRNEELERLDIPTVRIGGDELTQLDCFISAVEADPANLRAWGEIAKLMRYDTDDGQPPDSASSSPRGEKQRNSTTNSITSAEDVLHPREVEINGTLYAKAQLEAKLIDAKTPAHPHQVSLSMGMLSGSGVRLPPRGASARRQRQELAQ